MAESVSFKVEGLDELEEALQTAVRLYPDVAAEALKASALKFASQARKQMKEDIPESTGRVMSGFRTSPVHGYGAYMEVDFLAEGRSNPHFHLVENGHNVVIPYNKNKKPRKDGGKLVGWTPGYHSLDGVRARYEHEIPKDLEDTLTRVLGKAGLL